MPEDHSLHHEDLDDLKPQELAAMRWKAIEAFNGLRGISPMARRLGIKLIACMDARTRQCYPGEARIAAELGVHLSAVKKAKAELKEAGAITWTNPGGPRHLSHYSFDWAALMRCCALVKERGDNAVSKNIAKRRQGTHRGTMGGQSNSTRTGTIQRHDDVTVTGSKVPKSEVHSTQISSQGTLQGTPIVPTRGPDTTQDTALKDTAHDITPTQAPGDVTEKGNARNGEGTCHYPKLLKEFESRPDIQKIILQLSDGQQHEASKTLAMKGKEIALAFIIENSRLGNEGQ